MVTKSLKSSYIVLVNLPNNFVSNDKKNFNNKVITIIVKD